jgi:hypothetical protein
MTKALLIVTALAEGATGLVLLVTPGVLMLQLFGTAPSAPEVMALGRFAGAALLSLGVACWFASHDPHSRAARGLVLSMLLYNFAAVAILAHARLGLGLSGDGLWPAAGLHAALALWCVACVWGASSSTR